MTDSGKEKPFKVAKNVRALGFTSLFNDFSSEMILSVLPAFLTSVLGAGAAALGAVEGIADAAANITKIFSGRLSDKWNKRKGLTAFGYTLAVCSRPFYLLVNSVGGVIFLRFLDRVGKGFREPPRDALISLSIERSQSGRSFGFHRMMDQIGGLLGPLAAFVILFYNPGSYTTIFIIAFFVGIFSIISIGFVKDILVPMPVSAHQVDVRKPFSRKFKLFLLSSAILSGGSLPLAVLLLAVPASGMNLVFIPLVYAAYSFSYTLFSIRAGKFADSNGPKKVIIAGYGVLLVSYVFISLAQTPFVLFLGFTILGFFSALTAGVQRAYTSLHTDPEHRGSAFGYFNAAIGVGSMFSGIVGGVVWQFAGPSVALLLASFVIVVGLSVFAIGTEYLNGKSGLES
jgi:MFS family permease